LLNLPEKGIFCQCGKNKKCCFYEFFDKKIWHGYCIMYYWLTNPINNKVKIGDFKE